jgi:hypothetical protein
MPRHRSDAQFPIAVDVRSLGDEVEIDEMTRSREAKLHQRDKALSAGKKLGFFSQLAQ